MSTNTTQLTDKQALNSMTGVDSLVVTSGGEVTTIPKSKFVAPKAERCEVVTYENIATIGALKSAIVGAMPSGNNSGAQFRIRGDVEMWGKLANDSEAVSSSMYWTLTAICIHDSDRFTFMAVSYVQPENVYIITNRQGTWTAKKLQLTNA